MKYYFLKLSLCLCLALGAINTQAQESQWFIPATPGAGPAIFSQIQPVGYSTANQCCVLEVIAVDDYCVDTAWDFFCQQDYEGCTGDCSNPAACNYSPLANCDVSFFGNSFTCNFEQWYIPETPGSGVPAIFTCDAPDGYFAPINQCCLSEIIAADSYCVDTTWDSLCQSKLDGCTEGCSIETACNYSEFALCNDALDNLFRCEYESWYKPGEGFSGPAYFGCEPPEGYESAQDCCMQAIVDTDPFCLDNNWDFFCETAYQECLSGCSDPSSCNYSEVAICDLSNCTYPNIYIPALGSDLPVVEACEQPEGYFIPDANCVNSLGLSSCVGLTWNGSLCADFYYLCTNFYGCTDPAFCNYNPNVQIDDGSCFGISGCTNINADNYNFMASCDDGSCELSTSCAGDFNGDGSITSIDLTGFLAAYGTTCELGQN